MADLVTVTLTTAMSGARSWNKGDDFECDAAEAARLVEAGFAVPKIGASPATATAKTPRKETRG